MTHQLRMLAFVALAAPAGLQAQETGKIQGRIRGEAGAGVAGAQILVAGTRMGGLSDASGYYFINNIPAGVHDVRASFIGYRTVTVAQQRVYAGQTHTVDFELPRVAIAIEALIVMGERHPLVPRDQVASKHIVTGESVNDLPVDAVSQLLSLQPGVVALSERAGSKGIAMRGGRSGEEGVYIDGVLVRNYNEGTSKLRLGTNTLAELDVITGGFSAQYGEAQSGVINYVTRTGGSAWNGAISFQTDEFAPKRWSHGFNRLELSAGGKLIGNLGLFVGGTATGQRYMNGSRYWREVPTYIADGIDTTITLGDAREVQVPRFVRFDEGARVPYSAGDEYTLDTKLDYTYGSGSRVFVTGKLSRDQERYAPRRQIYNLDNLGGALSKSRIAIVGWTHNIVRTPEKALSLDFKLARQHDWSLANNLAADFEPRTTTPALGFTFPDFRFLINREDLRVDRGMVDNLLHNRVEFVVPFLNRTDFRRVTEFRMNPYGVHAHFSTGGLDGGDGTALHYAEEKQWQMRTVVDWQVNRAHRIKLGGDYFDIDIARFRTGYIDYTGVELWVENPKRASVFLQDRLDVGDLVLEAGVRYDWFDPNSDFPVIPGYYDPDDPTSYRRAPVRTAWSPRLGVSFPVTVNSTFRLNYGHFTQLPDLNEYYRGKNNDVFRLKQGTVAFARPLQLAKTVGYEFGYRQIVGSDFVVDVSAYHRKKMRDVTARTLQWPDPTQPGESRYLNTYTNADFGAIRGIDFRIDRRVGVLSGMLGYAYQDARSTGTDPFTALRLAGRLGVNAARLLNLPPDPPQTVWPTEEHRKHNFTGHVSVTFPNDHPVAALRGFGMFTVGRLSSGLAYTRVNDNNELRDGDISSGRMPWQRHVDMRLIKAVRVGGLRTQLVVDARNVLDFENQLRVWRNTDSVTDEKFYDDQVAAHRAILGAGTARDAVDLRSLAAAGQGVKDEVDLFLLRRAEQRFGNGDHFFSGEEQERAFRAAEVFISGPQDLIGPGRRLRFGLEFVF